MNHVRVEVVKNLNTVMENNTPPQRSIWAKIWTLGTDPAHPSPSSEILLFLRDICIILAIVLFVKEYIGSPFRISGNSMETNYHSGEFIIVDRLSYRSLPFIPGDNPAR